MGDGWQRWWLKDQFQINKLVEYAELQIESGTPITVQVIKPGRSLSQNSMIYHLYRTIADQRDDMTFDDVRGYCKLHFGIGIMKAADPAFCDWYDDVIKGKTYEQKLFFVLNLVDMTSDFDKDQAREYINLIIQRWTEQGIYFQPKEEMR